MPRAISHRTALRYARELLRHEQQASRKNRAPSKRAQRFIAKKIRRLAHEGMPAPRRVAAAYSIARRRGFRSVPKRFRRNAISESRAWRMVEEIAKRFTVSSPNAKANRQELINLARNMLAQLAKGVHENPSVLGVLGNPGRRGTVAGILTRHTYGGTIRYRHAEDGKNYAHRLGSGATIYCLTDGSWLIKHPTKRLWGDF